MTLGAPNPEYVRFGDVPWEPRTEDDWPPLVKRVFRDDEVDVAANIIWYGRGVVEPRHVHPGTHATWPLVGIAAMDGDSIGPWDLVYGPGTVPHGPLEYPAGCVLFGTLAGGTHHTAVDDSVESPASGGLPAHLVIEHDRGWAATADPACFVKTMVVDPDRAYTARLERWRAGSSLSAHAHPGVHIGVIASGTARVGNAVLGPWDLVIGPRNAAHGPIEFLEECTLLVNLIGEVPPAGG